MDFKASLDSLEARLQDDKKRNGQFFKKYRLSLVFISVMVIGIFFLMMGLYSVLFPPPPPPELAQYTLAEAGSHIFEIKMPFFGWVIIFALLWLTKW